MGNWGNRELGRMFTCQNLFHSFQEFNVEALREAYFNNPDGIANIQGMLGVLGNANLYLINPR